MYLIPWCKWATTLTWFLYLVVTWHPQSLVHHAVDFTQTENEFVQWAPRRGREVSTVWVCVCNRFWYRRKNQKMYLCSSKENMDVDEVFGPAIDTVLKSRETQNCEEKVVWSAMKWVDLLPPLPSNYRASRQGDSDHAQNSPKSNARIDQTMNMSSFGWKVLLYGGLRVCVWREAMIWTKK